MSLVVVGNRLIACYATVTGVEVDDEQWDEAIAWVAESNENVIVGNFELLGGGAERGGTGGDRQCGAGGGVGAGKGRQRS